MCYTGNIRHVGKSLLLDTEVDGSNPQLYQCVVSLSKTLYLQSSVDLAEK